MLKKKFLLERNSLQGQIEAGKVDLLAEQLPFDLDSRFHKTVHDIHEARL